MLRGNLRCLQADCETGFKPTIISLSAAPKPLPEFENLETYVCPFEKILRSPQRFLELWRKIRQLEPDIIQGWMYAGNLFASILAIGSRPPRVFHSVRASNMDEMRYGRQVWLNGLASHFPGPPFSTLKREWIFIKKWDFLLVNYT